MSKTEEHNSSVWVLYDAEDDQPFMKVFPESGSLAIFDYEEHAKSAKRIYSGTDYAEGILIAKEKYDFFVDDTQCRLDAMRLAIQGFVDAWQESGRWPVTDSEKNAIDQAFNECKKVLTEELKREPVGGGL